MIKRILALVLVMVMMVPIAVACNKDVTEEPTEAPTEEPSETKEPNKATNKNENNEELKETDPPRREEPDPFKDGKLSINGADISSYVIVLSSDPQSADERFANDLAAWVKKITGHEIAIVDDSAAPVANEIVVGNTTRPESADVNGEFEDATDYEAVLKNGKLAVKFNRGTGGYSALNAMQRSFANNDCNITKGFTNTLIELDTVKSLVKGAIRTETVDDGLHLYKSTQAQVDAWHALTETGYDAWTKENARSAIGIRLDFETDSSYIKLKLSKSTANMVLILNGKTVKTNWTGGFWTVPKADLGYTNRITVVMSDVRDSHLWGIQELEIDGGCKITPHKTDLKMLFFGDSITEQFFGGKTASHYTAEIYNHFNADAIVQGNGCGQFWPEMIDPAMSELYQPDVIIVALGTNDYSRNTDKDINWFEDRADAFLDKLREVYPDVPIIGITPLRRLISMTSNSENNYDKACVEKACAGYAKSYESHGAIVIQGDQLLSLPKHYNDTVHPNADGHALLGANLCVVLEEHIEKIIKDKGITQ